MTNIEVPTTENVRNVYAYIGQGFAPGERKSKQQAHSEFDRWLAAHDAEVAAKAEPLTIDRDELAGIIDQPLWGTSSFGAGHAIADTIIEHFTHLSAQEAATFKPRPFTDDEMNHPAMSAVFEQEAATEVESPAADGILRELDRLYFKGGYRTVNRSMIERAIRMAGGSR